MREQRLARGLSALAHPARLQIIRYLAGADGCCCKDVVGQFDLVQSTISQHLKVLVEAGLLKMHQEGQKSCYAVDGPALRHLARSMHDFAEMAAMGCNGHPAETDKTSQGKRFATQDRIR